MGIYREEERTLAPRTPGQYSGANCVSVVFAVTVLGQTSCGAIRGTFTDSSGAVIQGAAVTLVQAGTGETGKLASNSPGLYDGPNLPVGTYGLSVTATGFSTGDRTGIEVRVGQPSMASGKEI